MDDSCDPGEGGADDQAFGRSLRLLEAQEYKRVFASPCRLGNRYITILARQNDLNHPRLGLAISKKQLKRAVDRNRVKRLARESFRLNRQVIGQFDVVVMVRAGIESLERQKVRKAFDRFWQELAERCGDS